MPRDIEAALALMHLDVEWAQRQGGTVHGKNGVRAYWSRQWFMISPRVEPLRVEREAHDLYVAEVHQVIKDLKGALLADRIVRHAYRLESGKRSRQWRSEREAHHEPMPQMNRTSLNRPAKPRLSSMRFSTNESTSSTFALRASVTGGRSPASSRRSPETSLPRSAAIPGPMLPHRASLVDESAEHCSKPPKRKQFAAVARRRCS